MIVGIMVKMDELKSQIEHLATKNGLSLVLLFGSQSTGKTHKDSDIDVAYLSDNKLDFMGQSKINAELIEIFKNDRVDLVDMKIASPLLLRQITKRCHTLYERSPHLFNSLFAYVLKRYEESKPLFEIRERRLDNKIAQYRHA